MDHLGKIFRLVYRILKLRHFKHNYAELVRYAKANNAWIASQTEIVEWWKRRKNILIKQTAKGNILEVKILNNNPVALEFAIEILSKNRKFKILKLAAFSSTRLTLPLKRFFDKPTAIGIKCDETSFASTLLCWSGYNSVSDFIPLGDLLPDKRAMENALSTGRATYVFEEFLTTLQNELQKRGIPMVRVWYWPPINGKIPNFVFSSRHDIDQIFLSNLKKMIVLDEKIEARPTMYFRVGAESYTLGKIDFSRIDSVGLHHEVNRYSHISRTLSSEFRREKDLLERFANRKVQGTCGHSGNLDSEATLRAACDSGFKYMCGKLYSVPFPILIRFGGKSIWYLSCNSSDISLESLNKMYSRIDEAKNKNSSFIYLSHPEYFLLG